MHNLCVVLVQGDKHGGRVGREIAYKVFALIVVPIHPIRLLYMSTPASYLH